MSIYTVKSKNLNKPLGFSPVNAMDDFDAKNSSATEHSFFRFFLQVTNF